MGGRDTDAEDSTDTAQRQEEDRSKSRHIEETDHGHELQLQFVCNHGFQEQSLVAAYPASRCSHADRSVDRPARIALAPSSNVLASLGKPPNTDEW